MNTGFRTLSSVHVFVAAIVAVLLLVPMASQAQTFFGAGGSTNTATNVYNLAFGYQALFNNTTGLYNTANGYQALFSNTTGGGNTAIGLALIYLTHLANTRLLFQ